LRNSKLKVEGVKGKDDVFGMAKIELARGGAGGVLVL
jgi:hypothetical protein